MIKKVSRVLELYEEGIITFREAQGNLIDAATETPPAELEAQIPKEFLDVIREDVKDTRPRRVLMLGAFIGSNKEYLKAAADVCNAGIKIWHDYFEGKTQ